MPSIKPIPTKVLIRIFEEDGFIFDRQNKHKVYVKEGISRSIVIPNHDEASIAVIQSNMKTANMSRKRYFELLKKCK